MTDEERRLLLDFEARLGNVLRELKACGPWLTTELVEGWMAHHGVSRDQAIRELAEFEVNGQQILEATQQCLAKP